MKDLKTLGRTTWDKIKVGEVFAELYPLHSNIGLKVSSTKAMWLMEDITDDFTCFGEKYQIVVALPKSSWPGELHKLPLSVQKLWVEK